MWENNQDTLKFAADAFYRHEQIVLTEGNCPGFLPMTFLLDSGCMYVKYACGGFLPLSRFRIEETADVLYIMEKTLLILHTCPEYLLAPERLLLRTDTVFYNKKYDDLRIAFVPLRNHPLPGGSPRTAENPDPGSHTGGATCAVTQTAGDQCAVPQIDGSSTPRLQTAEVSHAVSLNGIPQAVEKSQNQGNGPFAFSSQDGTSSAYAFRRELLLYLAQLKQDILDSHQGLIRRLAEDLAYNCRDTSDMLRCIGLLRRELESGS